MKVAFATENGKHLDCPFERCPSFSVFEFSMEGYVWLETRFMPDDPPDALEEARTGLRIDAIRDCRLLFAEPVGDSAVHRLMKSGIMVLRTEPGAEVMLQLAKLHSMLKERQPLWLAKAMRRSERGDQAPAD